MLPARRTLARMRTDPAVDTRTLRDVWAVVRSGHAGGARDILAEMLGGVIEMADDRDAASERSPAGVPPAPATPDRSPRIPAGTADGPRLAAALGAVPAAARAIVWCDDALPSPQAITALVAALDDCDAVVSAAPVTDAVKRVRDGSVVAAVPRDGLCRPHPPVVLAPSAVGRILPALRTGAPAVAALAASRCVVRTVTDAPSAH